MWLVRKCLRAAKRIQGSVHSQNRASVLIWKGAPVPMVRHYPFSMPQLPTVALVTSVWAPFVSCPLSALECPSNLPMTDAATSTQGVEYWLAWLTYGQESITLQNWVLKAKILGNWSLLSLGLWRGGEHGEDLETQSWGESEHRFYLSLSVHFLSLKVHTSKGCWGGGMKGIIVLFLQGRIWTHCRKAVENPFSFEDPGYQLYFIHWLNETCQCEVSFCFLMFWSFQCLKKLEFIPNT